MPGAVIAWMEALPLFIVPEDYPNLLLSHTGHGLSTRAFGAVWDRDASFPLDGYYRVFGHTSTESPIITETYANIDTGCAYGGMLTALLWPSCEVVTQENVDR